MDLWDASSGGAVMSAVAPFTGLEGLALGHQ